MDDSDFTRVMKFIGDGEVRVVHTVSGLPLYFDLGSRILEGTGKKPLGVYLGQKPENEGGGYGPIETHMYDGKKLLVIDGSLRQDGYLHVLRTLADLDALRHPNVVYIIASPEFEMISPVDLLLRAYERDGRLEVGMVGKAASRFAASHQEEVLAASAKGRRRIFGDRSVREYGIGLALTVNRLDRNLYTEDIGDSPDDVFIVGRDDSGNVRLDSKEKKRRLLVISANRERARRAEKDLSSKYTVRVEKDLDAGIGNIVSGEYVPDVVFADVHLRSSDGSNGSGIARKTKGVPVFLMTPQSVKTKFLKKAMGDGARGVIVWPLTPKNVEEALKKVFEE